MGRDCSTDRHPEMLFIKYTPAALGFLLLVVLGVGVYQVLVRKKPASWIPVSLAAVLGLLLLFGVFNVLRENSKVAPWAAKAENHRVHYHLKNTTRIGGTLEDVRATVQRAVFLDEGPPPPARAWQDDVRTAARPGEDPSHAVVLPTGADDALAWALPGAYWAAYARVPVFFAGSDGMSAEDRGALRVLDVPTYVLAPDDLVPDAALSGVDFERIAGGDPASHAVRLARYRNEETGFGWGREADEHDGYFHFVLTAPSEAQLGLAALPLAYSNAAALLYTADDGGLPAVTDRYLWGQRADWFVTPSEGPFRHLWLIGNRTSYGAQGRMDLALEKATYLDQGKVALGPIEALMIAFIALGLAGALFVLLHGARLLPEVMMQTRLAWAFTALFVPVVGVILYLASYRRPVLNPDEKMPQWLRPPAIQAAAGTAMGFGYGAPLMVVIGFLFVWYGFPLVFGSAVPDGLFWLGAGMPIMMIGMYVGAVLLAWPLVQLPMKQMMGMPLKKAGWAALRVTTVSMAAVSLGMMTTTWFMMMNRFPMMPQEDDVAWFGVLWFASFVGFLLSWPLNWPMVRGGMKSGLMSLIILVLMSGCGSTEGPPVEGLAAMQAKAIPTAHTTRLPADNPVDQAIAITQTVYPATREENAVGAVILAPQDPAEAFTAMSRVTHMPVNAPLLYLDEQGLLPPSVLDEMKRLSPDGVMQDGQTQVYIVGNVLPEVVAQITRATEFKVRTFITDDPVHLAEWLDRWQAAVKSDHPDEVIISALDSPESILYGIGAMGWNAHMGKGFAWVYRDSIPEATRRILERRYGEDGAYMYLTGGPEVISDRVAVALSRYGLVRRVAGEDVFSTQTVNAGYKDFGRNWGWWIDWEDRAFGWGIAQAGHNYIVVSDEDLLSAIPAAVLGHMGKHGPILLVRRGVVPRPVRDYLNMVRPFPSGPTETILNHAWIIGDTTRITWQVQREVDNLLRPSGREVFAVTGAPADSAIAPAVAAVGGPL